MPKEKAGGCGKSPDNKDAIFQPTKTPWKATAKKVVPLKIPKIKVKRKKEVVATDTDPDLNSSIASMVEGMPDRSRQSFRQTSPSSADKGLTLKGTKQQWAASFKFTDEMKLQVLNWYKGH